MIKLFTVVAGAVVTGLQLINRLIPVKKQPSKEQLAEKAIHDARADSASLDADRVNTRTERYRVQRKLCVPLTLALFLLSGCGCSLFKVPVSTPEPVVTPEVVVIPADFREYVMTNETGVVGYFVPLAKHAWYMELMEENRYLRSRR